MSYLTVSHPASSTSSIKEEDSKKESDDLEVDNSQSVLHKIASLYAEQLMSDLVLQVGGVNYPAHRLILCASSEVFQVMLMNREWSEWSESRIVLQETAPAAEVFPHFLKYFYTGQIRISHHTVLPVLSLADKYNVKDLVGLCLCYMSNHIAQAAKLGQLISWMQYTMACGHNSVAKSCQQFVKWNMSWVLTESALSELEGETLAGLLQHSDLVLHDEVALYELVVRWLEKHRERMKTSNLTETELDKYWCSLVPAVFSHISIIIKIRADIANNVRNVLEMCDSHLRHVLITWPLCRCTEKLAINRFPMMCPRQLARLLLSPLIQEHKEFFMERMAIAMSYQSGQTERVGNVARASQRALFTPRLYTEDTWGSELALDNFHSLQSYQSRAFIFSTRASTIDTGPQDKLIEWTLEVYPKGVWFCKSLLIVWAGTYDVPEVVLRTVRVAVTCRLPPSAHDGDQCGDVRVKIGLLVWGVQKGVEHVSSVVERVHRFSPENRVLNIDDALDFDELNTPLYSPGAPPAPAPGPGPASTTGPAPASTTARKGHGRCANCAGGCSLPDEPRHLLGPNRDQLRIQIIIVPLTDFCAVGDPETQV